MHQAVILVVRVGGDAFAMEARKQRSRAGSIKTFVVLKDTNSQELSSSWAEKMEQPELLSIKGAARCVKDVERVTPTI